MMLRFLNQPALKKYTKDISHVVINSHKFRNFQKTSHLCSFSSLRTGEKVLLSSRLKVCTIKVQTNLHSRPSTGQPILNANKTSGSQRRNEKNSSLPERKKSSKKILKLKPPQVLIPLAQIKRAKHKSVLSLRLHYPPSTGVDNIT